MILTDSVLLSARRIVRFGEDHPMFENDAKKLAEAILMTTKPLEESMKVDLDGLARNIKACIDPKKDVGGWAYMVDEMVRHIRQLEANIGAGDTAISQLNQHVDALNEAYPPPSDVVLLKNEIDGMGEYLDKQADLLRQCQKKLRWGLDEISQELVEAIEELIGPEPPERDGPEV
jgi:hypothetical protein